MAFQNGSAGCAVALPSEFTGHEIKLYNTSPKFEGCSTNQDTYKAWALPPREQLSAGPPPPPLPFSGSTSYSQDFRAPPLPERPPVYVAPAPEKLRFTGTTTNADTYRQHPLEARPPPPELQPRCRVPFYQGASEAHDKFQAWPLERRPQLPDSPAAPKLPFQGCSSTHEAFRGIQLPPRRPSIGLATVGGGGMAVLIHQGEQLPASAQAVFTTVHDNQTEVSLVLLEGEAQHSTRVLGSFRLVGVPPGPLGTPRIQVEFRVSATGLLTATAKDLDSDRQAQWAQNGGGLLVVE